MGYTTDTLAPVATAQFDKVNLFGIPIANVTPEEAVECVHQFLKEDSLHHLVVVNTNKFWMAHHIDGMYDIIRRAEMIISEYGGVWASRVLGTPLKANV